MTEQEKKEINALIKELEALDDAEREKAIDELRKDLEGLKARIQSILKGVKA